MVAIRKTPATANTTNTPDTQTQARYLMEAVRALVGSARAVIAPETGYVIALGERLWLMPESTRGAAFQARTFAAHCIEQAGLDPREVGLSSSLQVMTAYAMGPRGHAAANSRPLYQGETPR